MDGHVAPVVFRDPDGGADVAGERHFGDADQHAAIGNVVARRDPLGRNQAPDEVAVPALRRQIHGRGASVLAALDLAQVKRLPEVAPGFADELDGLGLGLEGQVGGQAVIAEEPDAADGRCRQYGGALGFVVKRHVAGNDGEVQRPAGLGHAFDAADELTHDVGLFRVAEV